MRPTNGRIVERGPIVPPYVGLCCRGRTVQTGRPRRLLTDNPLPTFDLDLLFVLLWSGVSLRGVRTRNPTTPSQKAKRKSQKAKVAEALPCCQPTFDFCLLPFAFRRGASFAKNLCATRSSTRFVKQVFSSTICGLFSASSAPLRENY